MLQLLSPDRSSLFLSLVSLVPITCNISDSKVAHGFWMLAGSVLATLRPVTRSSLLANFRRKPFPCSRSGNQQVDWVAIQWTFFD